MELGGKGHKPALYQDFFFFFPEKSPQGGLGGSAHWLTHSVLAVLFPWGPQTCQARSGLRALSWLLPPPAKLFTRIISTAKAFPSSLGRKATSPQVLFWPLCLIHNTPPYRHPLPSFMSPSHNSSYLPQFYTVYVLCLFSTLFLLYHHTPSLASKLQESRICSLM